MKHTTLAALALALVACSKATPPAPPAAVPAVPAAVAPPAPAPAEPPKAAEPAPAPTPVAAAAPSKAEPPAPPATARLDTGHAKVGDAKCRMCHKLQHDSWSASPHAKKGLDCEGCHGGGADFTKVMRNRTDAIAAGLVLPKKEFCRGCHKADWQDPMFLRVHAHKAK